MKTFFKAQSQRAFTLIELLVVITVMAVLAAILFPVFNETRIQVEHKQGELNMQKLAAGMLQYVQDNNGNFPRSGYDCRGHDGTIPDDTTNFAVGEHNQCGGNGWQDAIGPYVHDPSVFLSPADHSAPGEGPWGGGTGTSFNTTDGNLSYLYNDLLAHPMPTQSNGYADVAHETVKAIGLNISTVRTPGNCLMLAEGHGGWDKASVAVGGPDDPNSLVSTDWTGSTDIQNKWHHEYDFGNESFLLTARAYDGTPMIRIGLPFNHNGGNVAFCDGHEKFVPYATPSGIPILCKTLPWAKTMDPLQRNADQSGCKDPNNPVPASWTNPNWF